MLRLLTGLLATPLILAQSPPADRTIVTGWTSVESSAYQAAVDHKVAHSGRASLSLKSVTPAATSGYAARQRIQADAYRGQRIRITGWLKTDQAKDGSAIWLRVDYANGDYVLDGMLELGPAPGWRRSALVADVGADAIGISFGVRMKGQGQVWADDFGIETVGKTVRTNTIERRPYRVATGKDEAIERMKDGYAKSPLHPINAGFETP